MARQDGMPPRLMMLAPDGRMAMIHSGRFSIIDAPTAMVKAGMTTLDRKTISDIEAELARI